ncbi:MAG TPA: pectinesterase family protein [Bacteroidota bacterium]|nr:pectinesterase family protein [Bacteroidota bacterium]
MKGTDPQTMTIRRRSVRVCFTLLAVLATCVHTPMLADEQTQITVARDGTGDFTSVQEAINSVPHHNTHTVTILIRKGVYHEKLYITTSFVTLVGEDRDSTLIVYAELRKNWNASRFGVDWGAAVVNIDSSVTDLTIANLTIYNNYGSLYGSNDHQFAIRGGGTRVMLLGCNVIADGGDTVSLWNRQTGLYYHADCYFEGYVDFVCPRGWCYITRSRFYGRHPHASIWHDGSTDKRQKFVIRSSTFDGIPGFFLGRNHRDGQFFLLECMFSERMGDRPIYRPESSPSPDFWGPRYYFYHCRREGGNYGWFHDNLNEADGSPSADEITARWTFEGQWDPESTIARVLPPGYWPLPAQRTVRMPLGIQKEIKTN